MKVIKLSLISAAILLFIACNNATQPTSTNNQPSPAAPPTGNVNSPPAQADEFALTRGIYARECSKCHGPAGDGGRVEIEGEKLKVPSLKKGHALNHTDEQLAKQIANGDDGMPAFKDKLSTEEINDLLRFIRKEFQGRTDTTGKPTAH